MKTMIGIPKWDELPTSTKNEIIRLLKVELKTEPMLPTEPMKQSDDDLVEAVFFDHFSGPVSHQPSGSTYVGEIKVKGAPGNLTHNRVYLISSKMLDRPYFRLPNENDYKRMQFKGWAVLKA